MNEFAKERANEKTIGREESEGKLRLAIVRELKRAGEGKRASKNRRKKDSATKRGAGKSSKRGMTEGDRNKRHGCEKPAATGCTARVVNQLTRIVNKSPFYNSTGPFRATFVRNLSSLLSFCFRGRRYEGGVGSGAGDKEGFDWKMREHARCARYLTPFKFPPKINGLAMESYVHYGTATSALPPQLNPTFFENRRFILFEIDWILPITCLRLDNNQFLSYIPTLIKNAVESTMKIRVATLKTLSLLKR